MPMTNLLCHVRAATCSIALAGLLVAGQVAHAQVAHAQDTSKPTDKERAVITSCLDAAALVRVARTRCIGRVSGPCLEADGATSTAAMTGCHVRENMVWDGLLNEAYDNLKGQLPEKAASALTELQKTWISWRDAKCNFPFAFYEGGSIARPISAACLMDATAARAIELRELAEDIGG